MKVVYNGLNVTCLEVTCLDVTSIEVTYQKVTKLAFSRIPKATIIRVLMMHVVPRLLGISYLYVSDIVRDICF